MKLIPNGSQTVGPFFRIGLEHLCTYGVQPESDANVITLRGRVLDGDGAPVPDAVLEFWHADAHGSFAVDPNSTGRPATFTRAATDSEGRYRIVIARPGPIKERSGPIQAPHIAVLFFARGLLRHLITRVYFDDEPANASDPVLQSIPADRRSTLVARRDANH